MVVAVMAVLFGSSAAMGATMTVNAYVKGVGGSVSATTPVSGVSNCTAFTQGTCTGPYPANATLTATASAGYQFKQWSNLPGNTDIGACAGSSTTTCTITNPSSTSTRNIVAEFAATPLDVQPIAWDLMAVDSNNPGQGPNRAPIGARVCNLTGTAMSGVTAAIAWDSANAYVTQAGPSSQPLGSLAATGSSAACKSVFFFVEFTRVAAAKGTNRLYRIVVVSSTGQMGQTPPGRRVNLTGLPSSNNNKTVGITSDTCTNSNFYSATPLPCTAVPSTMVVGQTYTVRYYATASVNQGATAHLLVDPALFQVTGVTSAWASPTGTTGISPFTDACGVQTDPALANFLDYAGNTPGCVGPRQVIAAGCTNANRPSTCKVGGNGIVTYTVKPIATGAGTIYGAVATPGHYNSDVLTTGINVTLEWPLNVVVGSGGTVASDVGGISCTSAGGTCSASYANDTTVTLTQTPNAGQEFLAWGGACTGSGATCIVKMTAAQTVYAYYKTLLKPLTVQVVGAGSGTVASDVGGISCATSGGTCSAEYDYDTPVTLTQTADTLMIFVGWGGDISGADAGTCTATSTTCVVPMDAARTVRADFDIDPELTVVVSGTGKVTSSSGGIDCGNGGTSCVGFYALNASVTLTETPGSGTTFTGWGGACSGTATTCAVTMDVAKSVTATFSDTTNYPLAVNRLGTGNGSVVSSPRRHQLRRYVRRHVRQRHLRDPHRSRGVRIAIRRLGRGMLGHRHLHGDDERDPVGDGHVHGHLLPGRQQERVWIGNRDLRRGHADHQLRCHL